MPPLKGLGIISGDRPRTPLRYVLGYKDAPSSGLDHATARIVAQLEGYFPASLLNLEATFTPLRPSAYLAMPL
jgi:hypothetical protein